MPGAQHSPWPHGTPGFGERPSTGNSGPDTASYGSRGRPACSLQRRKGTRFLPLNSEVVMRALLQTTVNPFLESGDLFFRDTDGNDLQSKYDVCDLLQNHPAQGVGRELGEAEMKRG